MSRDWLLLCILFFLIIIAIVIWRICQTVDNWNDKKEKNTQEYIKRIIDEETAKLKDERNYLHDIYIEELEKTEKERKIYETKRNEFERYIKDKNDLILERAELEKLRNEIRKDQKAIQKEKRELEEERKKVQEEGKRYADLLFELEGYKDEMTEVIDLYRSRMHEIGSADQGLWSINPHFFSYERKLRYGEMLFDDALYNAINGQFLFTKLTVNKRSKPISARATIISLKENEKKDEYETTLVKCSCDRFKFAKRDEPHPVICKHMLALAMKVGAINVDVAEVLKRGLKK